MHLLSQAELVAAVSNAGGLGILASTTFVSRDELRNEIRKTQSLTDKPFGVNLNLFPIYPPTNTLKYSTWTEKDFSQGNLTKIISDFSTNFK